MSPLAAVRRLLHSLDHHQPATPLADAELLDEQALAAALADGDVEANDWAHCPTEGRTRFHAIHTDGSRTCWTCRTTTGSEQ
ncbi:hypothetical protein DCW30_05645 [Streptomyces alfalfae]|uniref:Uncharacterized protein n=1 Tax=Streptomyces alfalfae TaxID=1642299 RepID=A0ABN4VKV0_9ACTN|nr:hypothetical protein [Streptomyces alfalfae]APY88215.1 hypothetical protein A7J05_23230 [Streptomyces alfalfae]AYA18611.1 hypothetical protein D3X13_22340 [Streptomyces fradiae]RXX46509.1 hypothetical protein DCW30_05645 [Streptomyces alfalfae]RZM90022.1 hypothetical protein D4104_25580 [Streptomyces alfalfae]